MIVLALIIGGGVGLILGFAVLIGQARAEEAAWRRIAVERRELHEWEADLIEAAEARGCAACRLRSYDAA